MRSPSGRTYPRQDEAPAVRLVPKSASTKRSGSRGAGSIRRHFGGRTMAERSGDPADRTAVVPAVGDHDTAHRPELGTQPVGLRRSQLIGCDHTFDHVGQHRSPRASAQPYGHGCTVAAATDRAVDTNQARGATEAGPDQTAAACLTSERSCRRGKVDRGGRRDRIRHDFTMNEGCDSGQERHARQAPHRLGRVADDG